jgi:aminomethyltransferase
LSQQTPLHSLHVQASAKMVDFQGWSMPINYGSQIAEHESVRNGCGIFDVSHMTILDFEGTQARDFIRYILSNDIDSLKEDGDGLYSAMMNELGGVIDDLIAYKMSFGYRLVVNCATREEDLKWISSHSKEFEVTMAEREDLSMLAIQGPLSDQVISLCSNLPIALLKNKKRQQGVFQGDTFIAKTGYTGELGFEVILPDEEAKVLWQEAVSAGAKPVGLGARDTLRLEAGMNLYGFEMNESISPLECNMGWTVSLKDSERKFLGKEAFLAKKNSDDSLILVGLLLEERAIIRAGHEIYLDSKKTIKGVVTSGTYSPTLKKSIALARIPKLNKGICYTEVRGKLLEVKIGKPKFIKEGKFIF